jgi:hypothetical protein
VHRRESNGGNPGAAMLLLGVDFGRVPAGLCRQLQWDGMNGSIRGNAMVEVMQCNGIGGNKEANIVINII